MMVLIYIHTMNPYMGKYCRPLSLFNNATVDFPYLFSAVAFDYEMLVWVIIRQIHLSQLNSSAYELAFSKIFTKCGKHLLQGKSLLRIITDWSDAEGNGFKILHAIVLAYSYSSGVEPIGMIRGIVLETELLIVPTRLTIFY